MNKLESLKNYTSESLNYCYNQSREFYKHVPPAYDIAVHTFRASCTAVPSLLGMAIAPTLFIQGLGGLDIKITAVAISAVALFIVGGSSVCTQLSSIVHEWTVSKLQIDQRKKNVVLFCRPTSDFGGATTTLYSEQVKALKEFSKTHSIVSLRVKDIQSLNKAIESITAKGQNITTLWINAHGCSKTILLGNEYVSRKRLRKIDFEKLDVNANIALNACSVGSQIDDEMNIAESMQYIVGPSRKVYAPNTSSSGTSTYCIITDQGTKAKWDFRLIGFGTPINANICYEAVKNKLQKLSNSHA